MVDLKDKTVEELRKMASRKKIEGRSKMNKAELVRALKKKSTTKKTMKRKKMRGGALTEEQIDMLVARNYQTNPLSMNFVDGSVSPIVRVERMTGYNVGMIRVWYIDGFGTQSGFGVPSEIFSENFNLVTNEDGEPTMLRDITIPRQVAQAAVVPAVVPVQSNRVNINAPNPHGISTHNDGQCAICIASTRFKKSNGTPFYNNTNNPSNKFEYTNTERHQILRKLRPCGHVFHRDCLEPVASGPYNQRVCPLCRARFRP
jgi:hypothetical protein